MKKNQTENDHLLDLFTLDYEKSIDVSFKLESAKLTYQRFYISLVTIIGTIAIGFLKLNIFKTDDKLFTLSMLIGLLLIFSSILGYTIIRNLVSIRRQCVHFNNGIIYLREKLIEQLGLGKEYPNLKKVEGNHHHSADYITILLCSFVNLAMLCSGISLLFNVFKFEPLGIGLILSLISVVYAVIHYLTVEKVLNLSL